MSAFVRGNRSDLNFIKCYCECKMLLLMENVEIFLISSYAGLIVEKTKVTEFKGRITKPNGK